MFAAQLESIGNWIYEDGDDEAKEVYIEKLVQLRVKNLYNIE